MSRVFIKPGSTTTEDSQRLEILDLGSICNVLCRENKGAAMQLICVFVFRICKFSHDAAQMYIKEKPLNDLSIFEPS